MVRSEEDGRRILRALDEKRKRPARKPSSTVGEKSTLGVISMKLPGMKWVKPGFRKAIAKLGAELDDEDIEDGFARCLARFRCIPDGWWRDDKGQVFWVLEIEDTSRLTRKKLDWYIDLWEEFDADAAWDFGLLVSDRYGNVSEVPLAHFWTTRLYDEV